MAKEKRFIKVCPQDKLSSTYILVDTLTGVNYLVHSIGYSGGLTPLLDSEGKVVVTPVAELK